MTFAGVVILKVENICLYIDLTVSIDSGTAFLFVKFEKGILIKPLSY